MKAIYCGLLFLCAYTCTAQVSRFKTVLQPGDVVPQMQFKDIINTTYHSASLYGYKKDLVILDFWSTWCSACIKTFPKLLELRKQFPKQLEILLVYSSSGEDDKSKVKQLFSKQKARGVDMSGMPVLMQELQLRQLFPYTSVPHIVWIYKGKLKAITDADELTAGHIETLLQGKEWFAEQKSFDTTFDAKKGLLDSSNAPYPSLLQQTIITGYRRGVGPRTGQYITPDSQYRRYFFINQSMLSLYDRATPGLATNRIILSKPIDSLLLRGDYWSKKQFYCFEMTVPNYFSQQQAEGRMLQQLDAQFGFNSRRVTQMMDCFTLVIKNAGDSLFVKDSLSTGDLEGQEQLRNAPMEQLLFLLNDQRPGTAQRPIVLDETGYKGLLNMKLPVIKGKDLLSIQESLRRYGMELLPAKRALDILLLTPANEEHSIIHQPKTTAL